MQQASIHHTTPLRFSRWSRAGYAAFRTLKAEVSIGRVHVEISDSLMKKTTHILSSPFRLFTQNIEEEEIVPSAEPLFLGWLLLPSLFFAGVIEEVASSDDSFFYRKNRIADKKGRSPFYPLFFYKNKQV